jgi:hypothetical protein
VGRFHTAKPAFYSSRGYARGQVNILYFLARLFAPERILAGAGEGDGAPHPIPLSERRRKASLVDAMERI